MDFRSVIVISGKVLLLTIILIICIAIAVFVSGITEPAADAGTPPANSDNTIPVLLISSLFEVLILTTIILRSRTSGWKLIAAVSLAFYGSMTFIAQMESFVYLPDKIPADLIPKLFVMGLIIAVLFTPLAVLILGKMKKSGADGVENIRLKMSGKEWTVKLALLVVIYLFLYYGFGYFVAWKNPAVRAYYGGTDPGNFLAQLQSIWQSTPWMFPFQSFRALLWVLIVLPMVRMLKGGSWQIGLMTAIFFSVWSLQLLMPNPYMPAEVTYTHFIETILSNFIFGWILGWMLSKSHISKRKISEPA